MEHFQPDLTLTSSEAASLLDVHPSTVKRWCNDGELPSLKTEGGHRRIPLGDAVAFARSREISTVLTPFHPWEADVWGTLQEVRAGSFEPLRTLAMDWVLLGRLRSLGDLFEALAMEPGMDVCDLCDNGIRPVMHEVGEEWARGRLRAGEEHMVSQVVAEVLLKLRSLPDRPLPASKDDLPVAVVGTLEGNQHYLGSLCIRLVLEWLGWRVHYLGPDVPVEDFGLIQRGRRASLVCVSLPPAASGGDVARTVRLLGDLYDVTTPYALALGGGSPEDVDKELLSGPFTDVGLFSSCKGFEGAVANGFGGAAAPRRTA